MVNTRADIAGDCCCLVSRVWLFVTPVDCSPPGSSVYRISQAKILERVAISFSRGSSQLRDQTGSPTLEADALTSEPPGKTAGNLLLVSTGGFSRV